MNKYIVENDWVYIVGYLGRNHFKVNGYTFRGNNCAIFMLPEGRAHSGRFVPVSVWPTHFFPEHIFQSIEAYLKLDTLMEGHEGNRIMQEL